jgi:transposase/arginine repressor
MSDVNIERKRKKRIVITVDICRNIRRYLDMEKSLKEISSITEVSYNSVLSIANQIGNGLSDNEIAKTRKGRKIAEETLVMRRLEAILEEDNSLNQKGMRESLQLYNIGRCQATISNTLKKMGITRKRLTKIPVERNSERIIGLRKCYARELHNYSLSQLVYLDETGFNLHTSTNYGYAHKNVKAVAMFPANKGVNISLMAAIDINGVIASELKDGAYNGMSFINFISDKLLRYFKSNPDSVLIMDNCRFHHSMDVTRLLSTNHVNYKFLPPYSPQLNPIEEFFGELKSNYKNIRPLSKNREAIKSRLKTLLVNRNNNFVKNFERSKEFLLKAAAGHMFI